MQGLGHAACILVHISLQSMMTAADHEHDLAPAACVTQSICIQLQGFLQAR